LTNEQPVIEWYVPKYAFTPSPCELNIAQPEILTVDADANQMALEKIVEKEAPEMVR
jgi:hypothetical protein